MKKIESERYPQILHAGAREKDDKEGIGAYRRKKKTLALSLKQSGQIGHSIHTRGVEG